MPETRPDRTRETLEKKRVASTSVLAGFALTGMKIAVGIATGSLGILAEAAHSALDLGAAALTYFAVSAAAKPPDEEHTYGHQRVENLSALAETLLLFITCGWIIWEAGRRLFFAEVHVEVTGAAFAVMGLSIVIDWSRSRALKRAAERYKSPALKADALHFSTDMASSGVVIAGLALVWAGRHLGLGPWAERADALAALGVAGIVIVLSLRLGRESVDVLMDRAPEGLAKSLSDVALTTEGVVGVRRVRVRRSGADQFVDLVVVTHGASPLEEV